MLKFACWLREWWYTVALAFAGFSVGYLALFTGLQFVRWGWVGIFDLRFYLGGSEAGKHWVGLLADYGVAAAVFFGCVLVFGFVFSYRKRRIWNIK